MLQRPNRGDPESNTGTAHERDEDGEAEQDEKDRNRAHAGLQRLRSTGESIDQSTDEAGNPTPNRAGASQQEGSPP